MISFSNINKQYGKELLFVDASFQLNPGEKVGLVGPTSPLAFHRFLVHSACSGDGWQEQDNGRFAAAC